MGTVSSAQHSSNLLVGAGPVECPGLGLPVGGVFILEVVLVVPHTMIPEKTQA